jgi:hypothetical protein
MTSITTILKNIIDVSVAGKQKAQILDDFWKVMYSDG